MTSSGARALGLYRGILRAHRQLPRDMRTVGDAYVKAEFRLHLAAREPFLSGFFREWDAYLAMLRSGRPADAVGEHLPAVTRDALTDEQRAKLSELSQHIAGSGGRPDA